MMTRRAHPAVTFFGTLISRSFSFVCLFRQSVHFLFIVSLSVFFRVSFRFHLEFSFVETVPAIPGRLEQHTLAPKFRAEVAFFFFNSSLLLLSFGNRTAKSVPIPFCSRDLPESFSSLLVPNLLLFVRGVQTFKILRKMAVTIYREIRADSPTHYRNNIREFSGR
jgi:hypothetical protein